MQPGFYVAVNDAIARIFYYYFIPNSLQFVSGGVKQSRQGHLAQLSVAQRRSETVEGQAAGPGSEMRSRATLGRLRLRITISAPTPGSESE